MSAVVSSSEADLFQHRVATLRPLELNPGPTRCSEVINVDVMGFSNRRFGKWRGGPAGHVAEPRAQLEAVREADAVGSIVDGTVPSRRVTGFVTTPSQGAMLLL